MAKSLPDLKTFLQGKPGVTITSESPTKIEFSVNHATGMPRSTLMAELMQYDVKMQSTGSNKGLKNYTVMSK